MFITMVLCGMTVVVEELPRACVKVHRGTPTLFINSTPHTGLSYMTYAPDAHHFSTMADAGVRLYSFSATPTESTYNLAPICWTGPGAFNFTGMDDRAGMVLSADPEAFFFPRLYLGTPPWWADAYPEELVFYDSGDGKPQPFILQGKRIASWASERWRRDTAEALRCFIRHVETSDYGPRVIGYHLASGTTEEWMQWGSNEDQWSDYSGPNVAMFRRWLKDKYGSVTALQASWKDSAVTFETASIPSRAARAASEVGFLRDPAQAQGCIDYTLYTSWLVADTIRYFAHVVKNEVHGERLVGVFYGYVLQLAGQQREQNSGHLALNEVLSCPDIDFVTSPTSYAFRQLGTGYPHAMSLVDSVKLHGKLWFDENDIRTWLTRESALGDWGKTATFEESLLAQQREFAWVLTNRLGMWWFDMSGGWYDDPRMLTAIHDMRRIAEKCLDADGRSVAEIAFVVDGKSSAYLAHGNAHSWPALVEQVPELGRIGAPFDVVHLADLGRLRKYKLYIFPNCFAPNEQERREIASHLRRRGRAVIWVGPAGLYRKGAMDRAAMESLTGLPLKLIETETPWRVDPTAHAASWGWEDAAAYGPGASAGKGGALAVLENPRGLSLGRIEGADHVGLAVMEEPRGLTVFSSVPRLPASLLRAIAKKAGVHLYIDTEDIVWACRDLLAVSVHEGGARTVRLPRRCRVVDLWTEQTLSQNSAVFEVNIPAKATGLFRLHEPGPTRKESS